MKGKILLIYTGGTIGMIKDKKTDFFIPFNFNKLLKAIPELKSTDLILDHVSISKPIDSLNKSVRNSFKFMGYNEVITYSFIDESFAELVESKKGKLIFVNNPISENMNIMRPSLLPGLLDTLSYNLNQGNENQKIFEIGTVFQKGKNHKINQKELLNNLLK